MKSYHYRECGLDNVYLVNGFTVDEEDGEEYVSIDDIHGLHRLIAKQIVDKTTAMTGAEYRFLRIEMNLSQKTIGELFGVDQRNCVSHFKLTRLNVDRAYPRVFLLVVDLLIVVVFLIHH